MISHAGSQSQTGTPVSVIAEQGRLKPSTVMPTARRASRQRRKCIDACVDGMLTPC